MPFMQGYFKHLLILAFFTLSSINAQADTAPDRLLFEQALFEHLQEQYLSAITQSEVLTEKYQNTSTQQQVLLSQSYYNYNLPQTAFSILEQSLKQKLSKHDKDLLLLHIAKSYYKNQQFEQALAYLLQIKPTIDPHIKQEYHSLLADSHIQLKQYLLAETQALALQGNRQFYPFVAHNLAIAYLNQNNLTKAAPWIQSINIETFPDSQYLIDSLQLAQGIVLLRLKRYAKATEHLKKISKDSALVTKGLLALGKALVDSNQKQAGKAYFSLLAEHPEQDVYYQESLLLSAEAEHGEPAKTRYQSAISQYEQLLTQLNELSSVDLSSCILREVSSALCDNALLWIKTTLQTPTFTTAQQQHQQLLGIQNLLFDWTHKIDAYHFILQQRKDNFNKKLPNMNESLNPTTLSDFKTQLAGFKNKIERIKNNQSPFRLANEDESDSLDDIEFIEDSLNNIPKEQAEEINNRTAFAKGVLLWELSQKQPSRLRQATKNLKEIERLLKSAEQSSLKLQQFNESGDQRLYQLSVTLNESEQQLFSLQERVEQLIENNKKHLSELAQHYLSQRTSRLKLLNLRAKYLLTQLQDVQG